MLYEIVPRNLYLIFDRRFYMFIFLLVPFWSDLSLSLIRNGVFFTLVCGNLLNRSYIDAVGYQYDNYQKFRFASCRFLDFVYFIDRNLENCKCTVPVMSRLIFYLVCKFLWKIWRDYISLILDLVLIADKWIV